MWRYDEAPRGESTQWCFLPSPRYYVKDRRAARGYKYWLTLRAMLFLPVHDIFVSSLVIKFIIDVAGTADKGSASCLCQDASYDRFAACV